MSLFKSLVTENPMRVEWEIAKRKMMPANWKAQGAISFAIVGVVYLGLFYMVVSAASAIDPVFLFYPMMILTLLVVPVVIHGSIAGERQSRSLEMLFAAPITPAQIVVGKLLRCIPAFLAVIVSCLALMITVAIVRPFQDALFYSADMVPFWGYIACFAGVCAVSVFVAGLGIWVSSRTKTTGAALLGTIGALILVFVIGPTIAIPFLNLVEGRLGENFFATHPVGFLVTMTNVNYDQDMRLRMTLAFISLGFYVLFGVLMVVSAVRHLAKERLKGVETK